MLHEIVDIYRVDDFLVVRAEVELFHNAYHPSDRYSFVTECEARLSGQIYDDLPEIQRLPESELRSFLEHVDPTWTPVQ